MISFFRSMPNIARTGVAMNATPKPIIPDRNDNPNNTTDSTRYSVQPSTTSLQRGLNQYRTEAYAQGRLTRG